MPRTVAWLAALVCAGWYSSSAFAWHPFAGLRHGGCNECATDQAVAPAAPAVKSEIVYGDGGYRRGILLGHGFGLTTQLSSARERVNQWLLDVPQKQPPPPPPAVPINPYIRSPRDFFMVD